VNKQLLLHIGDRGETAYTLPRCLFEIRRKEWWVQKRGNVRYMWVNVGKFEQYTFFQSPSCIQTRSPRNLQYEENRFGRIGRVSSLLFQSPNCKVWLIDRIIGRLWCTQSYLYSHGHTSEWQPFPSQLQSSDTHSGPDKVNLGIFFWRLSFVCLPSSREERGYQGTVVYLRFIRDSVVRYVRTVLLRTLRTGTGTL
jgi:hypothetical protein